MSRPHSWLLRFSSGDAAALAALRLVPGLEVAAEGENVWLRGPMADDALAHRLAGLPALDRFERLDDGSFRRLGDRIPTWAITAETLAWQSLSNWAQVAVPTAAFPAELPPPIRLRLVRSTMEIEPQLLLTGLDAWLEFVGDAPLVRLRRLRFAASTERQILVQGKPLPPIPGRRYVRHGRLAVPAGFHWQPAVAADLLARRFGVADDVLALWHEDHTLTRVHSEQFIAATRSAVRATVEGISM